MFYTNCDPNQPTSSLIRQTNRTYIHLYDQLHDVDLEEDMDCHMARVASLMGTSKSQAGETFVIKYILDRLPEFKQHALELGHLGRKHLASIANTLFSGVSEQLFTEISARLTAYLTPKREHQALPSPRTINNKLREWITELDPEWGSELPESEERLSFRHDGGMTKVDGEFAASAGKELHDIVRATAEKYGVSMPQALLLLVRGQATVNVTINLFGDASRAYLPGVGWLNTQQSEEWLARVTRTRDVTNMHWERTAAYRPSPAMRAYVQGRDGVCRFPGCAVPAEQCDIDHVTPFPEGPTTPANLQCVCRHHHNMKTDGRVHADIDAEGAVTWAMPDGTASTTEPEGPLSPLAGTWGRTLKQWIGSQARRVKAL